MSDNRLEEFDKRAEEVDPFKPKHSSLGWAFIGSIFVLACTLWFFAGPTYMKRFVLSPQKQSQFRNNASVSSGEQLSSASNAPGDGTIPGRKPNEMAIIFMDVKYGDGILVQAPDNTTSLIDGGEGSNPAEENVKAYDWAYELYLPLFEKLGIQEVKHLVSTVPLSHHMGIHADLIADEQLEVRNVFKTGYPASFYSFRRRKLEARNRDVGVEEIDVEDRINFGPGIKSMVLFGDDSAKFPKSASHVIALKYGEIGILLMSDLPNEQERKLVLKWADALNSNVVKVGRHGSKSSTSMELLRYSNPNYAVISSSRRNPLNAPHDEMISRLEKAGIPSRRILRTSTQGHVAMFTDGTKLRITKGMFADQR